MKKQAYLDELARRLEARGVSDVDEIVSEYAEHFARKGMDGYSEEEIAAKLGVPADLALEYGEGDTGVKKALRLPLLIALGFVDLCLALLYLVAMAWAAALAVCAIAVAFVGLCLLAAPLLPAGVLIPAMPYLPGAALGVAIFAFATLLALLAIYSFLLTKKSAVAFLRWQRGVSGKRKVVPYAIFPLLGGKPKRALRTVAIISAIVFVVFFAGAYAAFALKAGALEFWHVWHWFD